MSKSMTVVRWHFAKMTACYAIISGTNLHCSHLAALRGWLNLRGGADLLCRSLIGQWLCDLDPHFRWRALHAGITTRDASCHALKIDCGFDAGLLRNMRICVRGSNAGCGSNAGLHRNLRICRLRGAAPRTDPHSAVDPPRIFYRRSPFSDPQYDLDPQIRPAPQIQPTRAKRERSERVRR